MLLTYKLKRAFLNRVPHPHQAKKIPTRPHPLKLSQIKVALTHIQQTKDTQTYIDPAQKTITLNKTHPHPATKRPVYL